MCPSYEPTLFNALPPRTISSIFPEWISGRFCVGFPIDTCIGVALYLARGAGNGMGEMEKGNQGSLRTGTAA